MRDIQEVLEALGVTWGTGYMICPVCNEPKLTANARKNVATCWKCTKQWWPGKTQKNYKVSWGVALMQSIAGACNRHLAESGAAQEWLIEKRKLPNDIKWLQQHSLGAHPGELDLTSVIAKARTVLEHNREDAFAMAADDKQVEQLTAMFDREKKRLEEFCKDKLLPMFRDNSHKGSVVFLYENSHSDPISLNIRDFKQEVDKRKCCWRLQPVEGRRGVFCPFVYSGDYWNDTPLNTAIFEGEVNWLQMMAQSRRWADAEGREGRERDYYNLSGMAVGGKNGADIQTIQRFLDNYPPHIIYDNDTKDDATGKPQGYDLVTAINWVTPCYATTTRTKDMDDYIKDWNPQPEDVRKLIESAEYLPRPFESVKEDIDNICKHKGLARFQERDITAIVQNDMLQRGSFYNVSYGIYVWEQKHRNKLVEIRKGHPTWTSFLSNYGIQPGENLADVVGKNIGVKTEDPAFAPKNRIRILFQFAHNCLYINEYAGTVIKIDDKGTISRVRNGEDGVLFHQYDYATERDTKYLAMTPFKVDIAKAQQMKTGLKLAEGELLDKYVLSTVNYNENSISAPTAKQLLKAYILNIFFADFAKTKCFPVFDGPAGSGKNSIGYFLGLLLMGEQFSVLPMPEDPKALPEQMIDVPFCCWDEWDSSNAAVEKKLKSLATSAFEKRRELYTTFNTITMECQAAVMLSTNANPAKKAATSQRLLLFDVAARQTNRRDTDFQSLGMTLQPEFMQHRNEMWTELVGTLANMVRTFYTMAVLPTHFRMADFGSFFWSVATAEGWGAEAFNMLSEMQDRQITLAVEKSIVAGLLRELFKHTHNYGGKFFSAKDWVGILRQYVDENDYDVIHKLTPSYLGHVFAVNETILKETFRMEKSGSAKRGYEYAFWPEEGTVPKVSLDEYPPEYEVFAPAKDL